jgi:DNA invertase Pin-like site-specific DNA recombinase
MALVVFDGRILTLQRNRRLPFPAQAGSAHCGIAGPLRNDELRAIEAASLQRLRLAGLDLDMLRDADMPNANRLTVGIMAMVAEEEGKAISARTKAALAAAKKRDPKLKLGGYRGGKITPSIRKAASAARKARAETVAPILHRSSTICVRQV